MGIFVKRYSFRPFIGFLMVADLLRQIEFTNNWSQN